MLIQFTIQVDKDGVKIAPAAPNQVTGASSPQLLGPHFHAPGGGPPTNGPGGGPPTNGPGGIVFVVGPIIICGSGAGQTLVAGGPPTNGPGGGKGGAGKQEPAVGNPPAAENRAITKRVGRRARR